MQKLCTPIDIVKLHNTESGFNTLGYKEVKQTYHK